MDYLALVRKLQEKAGIDGPSIPAVSSQTGLNAKFVNWINDAWTEIQSMRNDWLFLRNEWQVALSIGKQDYLVTDDFGLATVRKFDPKDWRIEELTTDRSSMKWWPWARWRERMGPGPVSPGRPSELTFPIPAIVRFNTLPDKAYIVTCAGWMTSETITDNADIPTLPEEYHMAIVWKALEYYGYHEGAPELIRQGEKQFGKLYGQMVSTQTPPMEVGPCPLV